MSRFVEVADSIKVTVTGLYVSSSRKISMKGEIFALIRAFGQLKRLELHRFADTSGLEALWDVSTEPSLVQIVIKDYPEGNEKLR